ncbi:hypothetical protein GCM10020358_81020 [Amorphoplanes nipponensis]
MQSLEVAVDFIKRTGWTLRPAIGNAHGQYKRAPVLDAPAGQRPGRGHRRPDGPARRHRAVRRAVHRPDRPRLREGQHLDGAQGDVLKSSLEFLRGAAERDQWDPPALFRHQRAAVVDMARRHIRLFGGSGRAW